MNRLKKSFRVVLVVGVLIGCFTLYAFSANTPSKEIKDKFQLIYSSQKDKLSNKKYAVLIDHTQPNYKKRLWVYDMQNDSVVLHCHVSHAWKSGFFKPKKQSNKSGSKLTCSGVFHTAQKYASNYGKGKYAIGLRVKGKEKQNDNALQRNIVFHTGWGWSHGCFMTSAKNNLKIIEYCKSGALLYVHSE